MIDPQTAGLMSVEDLAARYQVSESTVHQWLYRGTAPRSLKIGRYRRFLVEDVLAWEETHASEPRPAA